ncbi:hypothetical protein CEUSTIGMA_g5359.t1 [Chlamydomonas eustigma]|uniref:Uncharacterized protein n=1 Tax=Chlamydomonas eustigma TaxID=1157962 RepID=A0A250X4A5_9CHLO|nr:hypothetical protein CEUSTIGMA_g5359.t1 [Chlamydomonas eustigma]|eukprot:GAX77917.1 hypothetical protein CEUSTIGMA_g5359.t1 [Chlamydomonas eustigma]
MLFGESSAYEISTSTRIHKQEFRLRTEVEENSDLGERAAMGFEVFEEGGRPEEEAQELEREHGSRQGSEEKERWGIWVLGEPRPTSRARRVPAMKRAKGQRRLGEKAEGAGVVETKFSEERGEVLAVDKVRAKKEMVEKLR